MHRWKVVKLSPGQLRDVREEDVLAGGWFRKCETYRGGGGYDRFPEIAERRLGSRHHVQFVVQLLGCNLDCPYCYVTREGVWGEHRKFTTLELAFEFAEAYDRHGATVFHLMGGAPALQLVRWPEMVVALDALDDLDWVFHSDMLLTERPYPRDVLRRLVHPRVLVAVDIKGATPEEHLRNTRRSLDEDLLWRNLGGLEAVGVPYYLTFTAVADEEPFWEEFARRWPSAVDRRRAESFSIDLIDYDALPLVDAVPWGGRLAEVRE